MSERIEATVLEAVGRGCGFVALCVGSVMNALAATPIIAVKAGGFLSLIVTFALMLQAGRTGVARTRIWREIEDSERLPAERMQALVGAARRKACLRHAYLFALAAAGLLLIGLAGDLNMKLYPVR
jgi:hypothetical protein